ncbi:MAG TPA: RluA family pseudouridine synthase [Burkholderiales bacterium]
MSRSKNSPGGAAEQHRVRHVEIDVSREGQRLDNFLLGQLKGVPKSHVYRILRRGEVRVNSARVAPSYRLQEGDKVRIPPIRTSQPVKATEPQRFEWLSGRTLYEDRDLLVLDKPGGLAVHGGSGVGAGLIEGLRAVRSDLPVLELAHRLDRDTSGCLLLAKNRPALLALHEMLRDGKIEKRYLALLKGRWRGGSKTVSARLARDRIRGGERLVGVSDEGRAAASRFEPKRAYGPATLVEIRLDTGRTHQARVHAAHIGHPIAGDEKYGDRAFNRELRELGLRRLFLHAARLRFAHPATGARIEIAAELPTELKSLLERLREPATL